MKCELFQTQGQGTAWPGRLDEECLLWCLAGSRLLAIQSCATWPWRAAEMVSLAGGGAGVFVLGLDFMLVVCFGFFFFFSDDQCKPQFSSSVCAIVSLGGISVTWFLGCWGSV